MQGHKPYPRGPGGFPAEFPRGFYWRFSWGESPGLRPIFLFIQRDTLFLQISFPAVPFSPGYYLMGNLLPLKYIRQKFGLGLQSVKYGNLFCRHPVFSQAANLLRQIIGLPQGIICLADSDPAFAFPAAFESVSILFEASGGLQDPAAAAVIHGQGKLPCAIAVCQRKAGVDAAAPPSVDDLIGVPHGKKPGVRPPECIQESQLPFIAVLHFVYNDPFRRNRIFPKKRFAVYQQIPECHGIALPLFPFQYFRQQPDIILQLVKTFPLHTVPAPMTQPDRRLQPLGQPCGIFDSQSLPPD